MVFENVLYFAGDMAFHRGRVTVRKGRIAEISAGGEAGGGAKYLLPGLIDLHCHGCAGADFTTGGVEALTVMAGYLAQNGVTSFLAASVTAPEEELMAACRAAAAFQKERPQGLSRLLGVMMEGPFLSEKYKRAHPGSLLQRPDEGLFNRLNAAGEGNIRILCIAPELGGAPSFIRSVSKKTVVAMAHTAADYKTAAAAIGEGATHLTHLYNAMPPFWHREPGVIGAAFEDGRVTAEVICDGVHVHESAVRAAFRLFGEGRVILVSDAVSPCGAGEGTYRLGVGTVEKKGRKALLEDGTLAGSVTHLFDCMKRAVSFQIPVEKAVRAAAYNPAALLGLAGEAGSVSVGKRADLILCDKALGIEKVYIEGEPVLRTK